jgi:integrase
MRGDGRIFRRAGSPFWWCQYYDAKGKQQREVCLAGRKNEKLEATDANEDAARKYLRKLVDSVKAEKLGAPAFLGLEVRHLSVNDILDKLEANYKLGGKRRIPRSIGPEMRSHLKRLRDYFGDFRAVSIDEIKVEGFVSMLLSNGRKNATVNRSLQLLKQAYKVSRVPCAFSNLPLLDESGNVRKGKFTPAEVIQLTANLPKYLADVAQFAYETGARRSEILKLKWNYVQGDLIAVPGTDTKNRKARSIVITPELEEIIARRRKARVAKCDLIFHHDGHPIRDYRKAWHTACVLTGLGTFYCRACRNEKGEHDSVLDAQRKCSRCGHRWDVPLYVGRIMHDFRRSAAHEMRKAGCSEEDCMQVTGHETRAMFKRYADLFSDAERQAIQHRVQEQRKRWRQEQLASMPVADTKPN